MAPQEPTNVAKPFDDDDMTVATDVEAGEAPAAMTPKRQHGRRAMAIAAAVLLLLLGIAVAVGVSMYEKNKNSSVSSATAASRTNIQPQAQDSSSDSRDVPEHSPVADVDWTIEFTPAQLAMDRSLAAAFDTMARGDYVSTQFEEDYMVTISATANAPSEKLLDAGYTDTGFTTQGGRIFDTANPMGDTGDWRDGDHDLGSPNSSCGGPGRGSGGIEGSDYENCTPLGNVLIIQEADKDTPDDYCGGGTLTFDFTTPATMSSITLFSITCGQHATVTVTNDSGAVTEQTTPDCIGMNGVYTMDIEVDNAVQVEVAFTASGAVADMEYRA